MGREPFLPKDIRYHCPTYCIFKFKKDISKPFTRKIWLYAKGDYDKIRQIVNEYDWASSYDEDVNVYATNFTNSLLNMEEKCIPSKTVTVRPQDLPWMNNNLRKLMCKRNRLFRKYIKDKSVETYNKFKKIRNEITSLLRKSKQDYTNSLAT